MSPNPAAADIPMDMLVLPAVRQLGVEVGTNCNLACVYCHFAPNERRGKEAPPEQVDDIIDFIGRFSIGHVTLSGDAEITLYPGWADIARRMLEKGARMRTISNFTKGIFSDDEVDVLSQFSEILVSLDTPEPELLRKVRYRADIRTIVLNVQRVRAAALLANRPMPDLVCNAVVYDKNIVHLDRLVAFAAACGFKKLQLPIMMELDQVPGGVNDFAHNPNAEKVAPVWRMPPDRALEALDVLTRAMEMAGRLGLAVPGDHIACLRKGLNVAVQGGSYEEAMASEGEGGTRACLMPWNYLHVFWNGDVPPCCIVKNKVMGNVNDQPLEMIFNGEKMQTWRRQLLTGDLPSECKTCTYVGPATTEELRHAVRMFVDGMRQWR